MTSTASNPNLITYNLPPGPDLNSASATVTPTFTFPAPSEPIILLKTPNPFAVCLHIKQWLLAQHEKPEYSAPGVLRMEWLELERMAKGVDGTVVVAPQVAISKTSLLDKSDDDEATLRITILALLLKHDPHVRWFYTLHPITPLLTHFESHALLTPCAMLEPNGPKTGLRFARIHTWLREAFTTALRIPHSPDWTAAQGISDFCPGILDPGTAAARLEAETALPRPTENNPNDATALQPSDDRYLPHLHPVERELAALAKLQCAEYLFTKRNFFRAFWEEVYRSENIADIAAPASTSDPVRCRRLDNTTPADPTNSTAEARHDTPLSPTPSTPAPLERGGRAVGFDRTRRARVRTERAHQTWLEQAYKLRAAQARALVVGWRVLGFLDERRYVGWVAEGWGAHEDDEESGEDDDGDEEGSG